MRALHPPTLLLAALLGAAALGPASARADPPGLPGPAPGPAPELPAPPAPSEDFPEFLAEALGSSPPPRPDAAPKRFHLAILPFVMANPLMGAGAGAAAIGGFKLDGPQTGFSRFEASGFLTANGQVGIVLRSAIRLPGDDWILVGDWGGGSFPNPAYGLGGHTTEADRTTVRRSQLQLHETVYRRALSHLYAGVGYALDLFSDITDVRAAAGEQTRFSAYPYGTSGRSLSSGMSLDLLWDGRDSPVAATRGQYLLARYRFDPALLSGASGWSTLYLDGRSYWRIPGRRDVLAAWAFAWSSFGHTPYLLLPSVGVDPDHRSARGYVEGRYTGLDLLYGELEYRLHLWQFLGAAFAAGAAAPSERGTGNPGALFQTVHPLAAAGLRVLLDRASGANLTLDTAFSPGNGVAFYVNANETF